MKRRYSTRIVAFLLFSALWPALAWSQGKKATDQTIKQAAAFFDKGEYSEAKKLYNQLVTFYPNDPTYNYRFGACVLYTEKDKEQAMKYLRFAASQPEVDPEAYYFLAQGYHYNYRFREAVPYYQQFLDNASSKQLKKFPAERDIAQARNGFQLLNAVSEPKVYERKTLQESDFHLAYKLQDPDLKFVKAGDDLLSDVDVKRDHHPLLLSKKGMSFVFLSSYGEKGENGLDLFRMEFDAEGEIASLIPLTNLNTPYDERYPFFDYDNNILYFASKGHNSMGGYDIFRSEYDPNTNTFGAPVNLDYAINTPDDDFLYAAISGTKQAWFASTRNNDAGKVTVFKIDPVKRPLQQVLLIGYMKAERSKQADITVEDMETGERIGPVTSRASDGYYVLKLKQDRKYRFLVEPQGSEVIHSGRVDIPKVNQLRPLKQEMTIVPEGGKEKLVIKNLFEEAAGEDDQEEIARFLSEMSSLSEQATSAPVRNLSESNETLLQRIKDDFDASEKQRISYLDRADRAYTLAKRKNDLAAQDLAAADQLEASLPEDSDSETYRTRKQEVDNLRVDATGHAGEAATAVSLAETFEQLAGGLEEEKKQAARTLKEMEAANEGGERNALVQSYLSYKDNTSSKKSSPEEELRNTLNRQLGESREAALQAQKNYDDLSAREQKLEENLSYYQAQVERTKDRKLRKQYEGEIEQIGGELIEVRPQVAPAKQKAQDLGLEAERISDELKLLDEVSGQLEGTVVTESVTEQDKTDITRSARENYETVRQFRQETTPLVLEELREPEPESEGNEVDIEDLVIEDELTDTPADQALPEESGTQEFRYDLETSPFEEHYTQQRTEVSRETDPYLQATQTIALNEAWKEDLEREIEFLEQQRGEPRVSDDAVGSRITELQQSIEDRDQAIRNANERLEGTEPAREPFQPDASMMEFASVQDLEDRFFFEFDQAGQSASMTDRLNRTNAVNQEYIRELDANQSALQEQLTSLEPGSRAYQGTQAEIEVLGQLKERKQQQVAYNEAILNASSTGYRYLPLEEELAGAFLSASPAEQPATAETQEDFTPVEVESSPEPVASQPEPVVADSPALEEPLEDPAPYEGDFSYFPDEQAIRKAPLNIGASPYKAEYQRKLAATDAIENPLTRAKSANNVNREWIAEMRKEEEVLEYNQRNVRDAGTKEILQEKRDELDLEIQQRQSRIQLNQELIQQLEAEGVEEEEIPPVEEVETSSEPFVDSSPVETPAAEEEGLVDDPSTPIPDEPVADSGTQNANFEDTMLEDTTPEESDPEEEDSPERPAAEVAVATEGNFDQWKSEAVADAEEAGAQVEQLKQELGVLNSRLEYTKKKKERAPLEAEAAQKQREIAAAEVAYEAAQRKPQLLEETRVDLIADPTGTRPSVAWEEQAEELTAQADDLDNDVIRLRGTWQETKKKKEKARLAEELEATEGRARAKRAEAQQAQSTADDLKAVEEWTLKTSTPYGERIVVSLPEAQVPMSPEEEEEVKQTEAYTNYDGVKQASERKLQEAEVLYKRAAQLEQEANGKQGEATSIRNGLTFLPESEQADARTRADRLEREANELRVEATESRQEATALKQDAYYSWNNANRDLLAEKDGALRDKILTLFGGTFSPVSVVAEGEAPGTTEEEEVVLPTSVERDEPVVETSPALPAGAGLELSSQETYYSASNPIPIDPPLPSGVVYKVQIGAFRNPVPNDAFRGFRPIVGESAGNGLTRYLAGNFNAFEDANTARNDIRNLGYSDAFVVAYRNGQRISLAQARAGGAAQASTPAPVPVPANEVAVALQTIDVREASGSALQVRPVSERAELFYTVQVGVYAATVTPQRLFPITPLNSDRIDNGLIRYSSGVFGTVAEAARARSRIVALGISDAFITAYYQGERITVARARALASEQPNTTTSERTVEPLVEEEDTPETTPEITSSEETPPPAARPAPVHETVPVGSGVQPRIVGSIDEETGQPEEILPPPSGQGLTEVFKVEAGPYAGEVPVQEASVILEMTSVGIQLQEEGSDTYYILGNYATSGEAEQLRQILIQRGIASPRVVKFVDDQKVAE